MVPPRLSDSHGDHHAVPGPARVCRGRLAGREGEIGDEIDTACWGRGYATEAANAMVRFGFEELGLHRIRAWTVAGNAASRQVLEKLGLRLEGQLRENRWFKGRWWDTALYGILEEEWLTSQKGGEG